MEVAVALCIPAIGDLVGVDLLITILHISITNSSNTTTNSNNRTTNKSQSSHPNEFQL